MKLVFLTCLSNSTFAARYTTGVFSKEELEASAVEKEKCVVLDGLNDLEAVLKAFELASP